MISFILDPSMSIKPLRISKLLISDNSITLFPLSLGVGLPIWSYYFITFLTSSFTIEVSKCNYFSVITNAYYNFVQFLVKLLFYGNLFIIRGCIKWYRGDIVTLNLNVSLKEVFINCFPVDNFVINRFIYKY